MVESIIAYVGDRRIEQDEQIRNAIKVILKTTERYYRSLLEIPADEEAQKYIYKSCYPSKNSMYKVRSLQLNIQ